MRETNCALEETTVKYTMAYLEVQRKTAIHNASYVPQYTPQNIFADGIPEQYMSQLRSSYSCITILL